MRARWHYLYAIFYPSRNYQCYYGSRITDNHPDEDDNYFGSSVTFAHYNDQSHADYQPDALKVIIWSRNWPATRESADRLSLLEAGMIKQALKESGTELCLNRNYAGRIILTPEEHARATALGGQISSERRAKAFSFVSPDGDIVRIKNLRAFCREYNLSPANMRKLNRGERQSHKGWRRCDPRIADLA